MTTAATASPCNYRLGIDVDDTFTDLTLLELAFGHLLNLKTPTTPQDPTVGTALELIRQGLGPDALLMESDGHVPICSYNGVSGGYSPTWRS